MEAHILGKQDASGHISYPLGKDAVGYIIYNRDGYTCS
jgi:hypothetical protein